MIIAPRIKKTIFLGACLRPISAAASRPPANIFRYFPSLSCFLSGTCYAGRPCRFCVAGNGGRCFFMKTLMLSLMIMGLAGAALAIEPAELDNRVRELTAKFDMMQSRADKGIPADVLRRAQGVILLD